MANTEILEGVETSLRLTYGPHAETFFDQPELSGMFHRGLSGMEDRTVLDAVEILLREKRSAFPGTNWFAEMATRCERVTEMRAHEERRKPYVPKLPGSVTTREKRQAYSRRHAEMLETGEWKLLRGDPLLFWVPMDAELWPGEIREKLERRIARGYGQMPEDDPRA